MRKSVIILTTLILAGASATAGILSPRGVMESAGPTTRASQTVSAYIVAEEGADPWESLKKSGIVINLRNGRMATARMDRHMLREIADFPGVAYVQTATGVESMLDNARQETCIADCWQTVTAGNPDGFNGSNVVVGIIDAGFDYGHESFRDSKGNLRIERVWEQSTEPGGGMISPEKYGYGVELRDAGAIAKAQADITGNSHGTHVASIAAGSSGFRDGAFKGVAPGARIVLVSMGEYNRDNVNLTNAISYIFDYAESLGLPCVINLSLGNHAGPHDGTSPFDQMADALTGAGRLLVGSAGNHGSDHFHFEKNFTDQDMNPARTFLDYRSNPSAYNTGGEVDIWLSKDMTAKVELVCWSNAKQEATERIELDLSPTGQVKQAEFGSNIKGSLSYTTEYNPLNGKLHILLTSGITSIRSRHGLGIEITPLAPGHVDIWADNTYLGLTDNGQEGWSGSNGSTIAEIGGTASRMLSVGAYTTRNSYTVEGSSEALTLQETVGSLSSFSSYGPTSDGRIKPEVIAPGCFIVSSVSQHDNTGVIPRAATNSVEGDRDYAYGYMQGTSMSAPFVTGTVALWLQADPLLTPETVKEIISRTARSEGREPDSKHGYGKISPRQGLDMIISGAGISRPAVDGKSFQAIGGKGMLTVHASDTERISVYRADGSNIAVCSGTSRLTLPAGIYIAAGNSTAVKVIVR